MNGFEAILLGVVQGLTEFLPISSSGHLILVPWLADFSYLQDNPDFNKTFDVALHLGTLVGVVVYFNHELAMIVRGAGGLVRTRRVGGPDERLALLIGVGTIPAVIAGGLGEDFIDERLGEPWQIAIGLAVFGLVLAWADRRPERAGIESLTPWKALQVGVAQALALMPGVSRSGVTISAGRLLGLDRDSAARFAFLLLIPAVAGASVLKGIGAIEDGGLPAGTVAPTLLGMATSAVASYAAIAWMLAYVRRHSYDIFVVYRLVAAAAILALIATGARAPTF